MTKNFAASKPEWIDPDDAPELDDYWFDHADLMIGRVVIRRGRPPGESKAHVSLRIDKDVLAKFRADGPGWQSRINAALRKAAGVRVRGGEIVAEGTPEAVVKVPASYTVH